MDKKYFSLLNRTMTLLGYAQGVLVGISLNEIDPELKLRIDEQTAILEHHTNELLMDLHAL